MCTVDWALLLEYLKVLFSWPPVAAVVLLVFISRFRGSIDDFARRVVESKIFGQEFKAVPPTQTAAPALTDGQLPPTVPIAARSGEAVQPASGALPPELASDPNAPAAVDYARNNPAQAVLEYKRVHFAYGSERMLNQIYGTQIQLLEHLASKPEVAASLSTLRQFHEEHQRRAGSTQYEIRPYVEFLVNSGVLQGSGPDDAREYRISQRGVEFLSYIKANYPASWNRRPY